MNREDIIRMAREAGLMSFKYPALIAEPDWEATERFASLVAAASASVEREACAKVCGDLHLEGEDDTGLAADLIRARRNT